jgi:hypothetical protein
MRDTSTAAAAELAVQRGDTLAVAMDAAGTRQRSILVPDKTQVAVSAGMAPVARPAHRQRITSES